MCVHAYKHIHTVSYRYHHWFLIYLARGQVFSIFRVEVYVAVEPCGQEDEASSYSGAHET